MILKVAAMRHDGGWIGESKLGLVWVKKVFLVEMISLFDAPPRITGSK